MAPLLIVVDIADGGGDMGGDVFGELGGASDETASRLTAASGGGYI